jgi:hypothetical protein
LLKIYILKQITAYTFDSNRIAVHLDTGDMGNRPFNRHEPFTQVLIDSEIRMLIRDKRFLNREIEKSVLRRTHETETMTHDQRRDKSTASRAADAQPESMNF